MFFVNKHNLYSIKMFSAAATAVLQNYVKNGLNKLRVNFKCP